MSIGRGGGAPSGNAVLVALVAAVAIVVAGYVGLTVAGYDGSGLFSGLVTIAGVLGLGAHVETRVRQQNEQLQTITRQTNGVLDARIHEQTAKAVRKVLAEQPPPVDPPPFPPAPPII